MSNRNKILIVALPFLLMSFTIKVFAGDLIRVKDLKGLWKFSIGEREEWISPKFDDRNWESVQVPSPWENQGFYGYNGYAFYRKSITISSTEKGKMLYLTLGFIDDVDETYFNGHKIGSTGSFPPKYETAYNAQRKYYIPEEIINFDGVNVLSVKVYDAYQAGGIVSGDISICTTKMGMQVDFNLQGSWKFRLGDDQSGKEPEYNDTGWDEIFVPAKWEDQGYRDYDGYAWYRKTFVYKTNSTDDKMVVLLGKIDDIDQVFINGMLIGSTGGFPGIKAKDFNISGQEYNAFRGYYFPAGLLKKNQNNVIAVRVYDSWGAGGIYEGPVGIISQTKYIEFWKRNKNYNK